MMVVMVVAIVVALWKGNTANNRDTDIPSGLLPTLSGFLFLCCPPKLSCYALCSFNIKVLQPSSETTF